MIHSWAQETSRSPGRIFLGAVWPAVTTNDSESLRRRKLAVRAGNLAMAVMIIAAVCTTFFASPGGATLAEAAGVLTASIIYVGWNLLGTRGVVTLVLWDKGDPPPANIRTPPFGAFAYFAVQLALASTIYAVTDRGGATGLAWLVLLPPVAYSVFLLEWRGITIISLLIMAVMILDVYRAHGWKYAAYAGLAFSFAVLFTLVFTLLAVHSEKARNEVQRLAAELGETNRKLREYAVQAEDLSATRERNRIAREIHDSLGHYLTVANMQLEAAKTLWSTDPDRAREAVAKAQSFTQEGLRDIRHSVASLRSSPLDNKQLAEALRELATAEATGGRTAEFQVLGKARELSPPVELSLFRAGQEGLTNARKHSKAKLARIVLNFSKQKMVSVSVTDDGNGASEGALAGGFGLIGLRERAQLLGGQIFIQTAPNAGFSLTFEVPS